MLPLFLTGAGCLQFSLLPLQTFFVSRKAAKLNAARSVKNNVRRSKALYVALTVLMAPWFWNETKVAERMLQACEKSSNVQMFNCSTVAEAR